MDLANLFIPAGTTIDGNSSAIEMFACATQQDLRNRWDTDLGKEILRAWKDSNYSHERLETLVGRLYEHYDLRCAPLKGTILRRINLSNIDLYAADLENADLSESLLDNTHLSEANIKGCNFSWARVNGTFFDNAQFDKRTNFLGVNINSFNSVYAILLQDYAHTQQRIHNLEKMSPKFAIFLKYSCDYGRSLSIWSGWVIFLVVGFAILYYLFPGSISSVKNGVIDHLYFSVITFTTLGYGDIVPVSFFGKIFAMIEVIIGYLMGGLLVAILAKRILG